MNEVIRVSAYKWEGGQPGMCFLNVQTILRLHGGEAVYGWVIQNGPIRANGRGGCPIENPLYRRWTNHVIWRAPDRTLWEVTPQMVIVGGQQIGRNWAATEFVIDPSAIFVSMGNLWYSSRTRYESLRPEGDRLVEMLNRATNATNEEKVEYWYRKALEWLKKAGHPPIWARLSVSDRIDGKRSAGLSFVVAA